jgi:hypothetical protein
MADVLDSIKASTQSRGRDPFDTLARRDPIPRGDPDEGIIQSLTNKFTRELPDFKRGVQALVDDPSNVMKLRSVQEAIERNKLPGDVYAGRIDPTSEEAIIKSFGIGGGLATSGLAKSGLSPALEGETGLGIFAGPRSRTADHRALMEAIQAEKGGVHRQDILEGTSWFKGPDGKWRYEISDENATLHPMADRQADQAMFLFDHPEFYAAYPEAARTMIAATKPHGGGSSTRPGGSMYPEGRIDIPSNDTENAALKAIGKASDPLNSPLSVALHEFQHQVQAREGFTGGASPSWIESQVANQALSQPNMPPSLEKALEAYLALPLKERMGITHNLYRRNAGEVEAAQTQYRQPMSPIERRQWHPMDDLPPWIKNESDIIVPYKDIND